MSFHAQISQELRTFPSYCCMLSSQVALSLLPYIDHNHYIGIRTVLVLYMVM